MPIIVPGTTALIEELVVHCFWHPRCGTVIRDVDARTAHARMEQHYAEVHQDDIATIIGGA